MKHISVIVPNGQAVLSSVIGAYKIFNRVNEYLIETGQRKDPAFHVELVGINKEQKLYDGAFTITPHKNIDQVKKTDLIIITTIMGDMPVELENNAPFVPWIVKQRTQNNAEIASLCMGAFLLANTGLLDGKSCSTHWMGADAFRAMFPKVDLRPEKIITEDNGIYSSGGAYSFLNLLLHLVEKYAGKETAIFCSKLFEIDIDRIEQRYFTIFNGQKSHDDEPIKEAQQYIENNYQERISVDDLAKMFALSRRNFIRRFKSATSNTPLEYIQRVKIEAAKKTLESTPENITQVMYSVGYSDTKAFRNVFKKFTGLSPVDYKNKYNRQLAA